MAARADERLGDTMRRVKKEGLAADIPRRLNFAVRAGRLLRFFGCGFYFCRP